MFINIITPCIRPKNLLVIAKSINIPKENYRWIVVFDAEELPSQELIPNECEVYAHKNPHSTSGNDQRNYAINKVEKGHLYFNDDDTILHKNLWENIKNLDSDFITFKQEWPDGKIRLEGKEIGLNVTDSHNFIVKYDVIRETRWILNVYGADGIFADTISKRSKSIAYIPKVLSTYNFLKH